MAMAGDIMFVTGTAPHSVVVNLHTYLRGVNGTKVQRGPRGHPFWQCGKKFPRTDHLGYLSSRFSQIPSGYDAQCRNSSQQVGRGQTGLDLGLTSRKYPCRARAHGVVAALNWTLQM